MTESNEQSFVQIDILKSFTRLSRFLSLPLLTTLAYGLGAGHVIANGSTPSLAKSAGFISRIEEGNTYYPVTFNDISFAELIASSKAKILLPMAGSDKSMKATVSQIDNQTSSSGDVVYSGVVTDPETNIEIGYFTYAHFDGSQPYLAVTAGSESYEIFEDGSTRATDFVLRHNSEQAFKGRVDVEPEEWEELLATLPSEQVSNSEQNAASRASSSQSRSSCLVDVGVGYTSAALARNGSIVSSIGAWMSNLNNMVDSIGVTCNYRLVGTLAATYQESTNGNNVFNSSIVTDIFAIDNDPQIVTWKNNTVNADLFMLITSAAINAGPLDLLQGVVNPTRPSTLCHSSVIARNCGEYGITRDDFAFSIRVFAHEMLHMAAAQHEYAYGHPNTGSFPYGGLGFTAMNNSSEQSVTGSRKHSTTVMSNPLITPSVNLMCASSGTVINLTFCGQRLPYIASRTTPRSVQLGNLPWFPTVTRYFPPFYPSVTSAPYTSPSDVMATLIQNGMSFNQTFQ
ncbi:MAG: hypothetical protein AAF098_16870 [Pseudomonadota bacterium]